MSYSVIQENKVDTTAQSTSFEVAAWISLLKLRLSSLVVFSGGIAYLIASESIDSLRFILFLAGGLLITGASNIINQIIERDYDKLMDRTKNRSLPTSKLSVNQAVVFCIVLGVVGFGCLLAVNTLTALLTLLSLVLYGFVYTPLKRVGPIAVFVGAIPGALPPLIGWVAAAGEVTTEALILFGFQFIWQFPHFWAIAWVLDEDYSKAGFRLLPSQKGTDLNTAIQILIYALFLIPIGLLPAKMGMAGITSAIVSTVFGVLFLAQTAYLIKECSRKAALQVMFGSFIYLPVVQLSLLIDKI